MYTNSRIILIYDDYHYASFVFLLQLDNEKEEEQVIGDELLDVEMMENEGICAVVNV